MFDEPTSALDPLSTSKIEEPAATLSNDITIIVTHNMQQAARISDWAGFLMLGNCSSSTELTRSLLHRLKK